MNNRKLGTDNENNVGALLSCWYTGETKGTKDGRVFHRQRGSGGERGFRGDLKTPDSLFLHIECKDVRGWELTDILRNLYESDPKSQKSVINWWKQCCRDARKRSEEDFEPERLKWLIFTRSNQPQYLMMESRDWMGLNLAKDGRRMYRGRYINLVTEYGTLAVLLLEDFLEVFSPEYVSEWSSKLKK